MTDIDRLTEMHSAATPGEWAYRPDEFDDWGVIKGPLREVGSYEPPLIMRGHIAQMRDPDVRDEETLNGHRRAGTDPWAANAECTVALHNAFPDLAAAWRERDALRERVERLETLSREAVVGRIAMQKYGDWKNGVTDIGGAWADIERKIQETAS